MPSLYKHRLQTNKKDEKGTRNYQNERKAHFISYGKKEKEGKKERKQRNKMKLKESCFSFCPFHFVV